MLVTAALLLASCLVAGMAHAQSSTIGRTWPIAEPDALAEIEAKAATLKPDMTTRFGPRSRWQALKAASLDVATADRVRTVIPFHTLDADIVLPNGRILYPRGFTFNPLAFVSLPQRLVVVEPADLAWALGAARATDFILLAAGRASHPGNPDIIGLSDRVHRPLFILEPRVKARLGLTVAPVIVAQSGQKLVLTEIGPRRRGTAGAGGGS